MNVNFPCIGKHRGGYVYLLMVLFVGVIALTVLGSYMLLSVTAMQTSRSVQLSMQALSNANTCVERALLSLQSDVGYTGNETLTLSEGSCTLEAIGGNGTQNRTVCATGSVGNATRRVQVYVNTVLPAVQIRSWSEVTTFTLC